MFGKEKEAFFHAKVGYMDWARVSANRTVGGGQMSKLLIGTSTRESSFYECQLRTKSLKTLPQEICL